MKHTLWNLSISQVRGAFFNFEKVVIFQFKWQQSYYSKWSYIIFPCVPLHYSSGSPEYDIFNFPQEKKGPEWSFPLSTVIMDFRSQYRVSTELVLNGTIL